MKLGKNEGNVNNPVGITTGYEGPTDSCLVITDGENRKEFLIDGLGWKIVSSILPSCSFSNPLYFRYWRNLEEGDLYIPTEESVQKILNFMLHTKSFNFDER